MPSKFGVPRSEYTLMNFNMTQYQLWFYLMLVAFSRYCELSGNTGEINIIYASILNKVVCNEFIIPKAEFLCKIH